METTNSLTELRKELPHGAIKLISDRSGINYYTVLRTLNGDKRSPKFSEVITATAEYLTEYNAREAEAIEAMTRVLNPTI